jgi:hypothetical protein
MAILIKPAQVGTRFATVDLVVLFDATLSDSRTGTVTWTDHAVEDGATISDHATRNAEEWELGGVLTRTPFAGMPDPTSATRVEDAIDRLFAMKDALQPVTISNGLHVKGSLGITRVSVTRSGASDGQSPRVSVGLKEIVVVSAKTAQIAPARVAPGKRDSATGNTDAGTQSATDSPGTATKATVEASVLSRGVNYITGG